MNYEEFGAFIERQRWVFAKTYSKFAPHEYIVRNKVDGTDKEFVEVVEFIREKGFPAYFGRQLHIYLQYKGRYYWTMGDPIPETIILNRCEIDDYVTAMRAKK